MSTGKNILGMVCIDGGGGGGTHIFFDFCRGVTFDEYKYRNLSPPPSHLSLIPHNSYQLTVQ